MSKVFGREAVWNNWSVAGAQNTRFQTRNQFGHVAIVSKVGNDWQARVMVDKVTITYSSESMETGKKWASDILDLTHLMEHLNYDEFNSRTLAKDPKATLQWYAMSYAALTGDLVEMDLGACTFEVL